VDDVRFLAAMQRHESIQQQSHGRSRSRKALDGQYPSLWVADGGGGPSPISGHRIRLRNPDSCVEHDHTGHVYELSTEHHVRNEIKFDHVENWTSTHRKLKKKR